ncbi:Hsp20 family protein [Halocalculus aciditolerans]|uniref:Heat-shock protein Hsp20 n=1 Tax=Halocalculus aciditolerans TaxID=1383812 RepID=A0A830FGK0_9EURY|nr:Hsp20 family protein [Halocalculus aciditolerans]GGL72443.1 heat-shock protein Hsp20 [Halocalculus aciditolerans]
MRGTEFGKALGTEALKRVGRAASRFQEERPLPVDVLESDEEYLVVFDAPGVTSQDVQVDVDGREVRARIDRFREPRPGFEMRFPGRGLALDGSAKLPADADVDADATRAQLNDDGTLYVYVPKRDSEGANGVDVSE